MLQERCTLCLNEIHEHVSPVFCSGLGKIGQAGSQGIVTPWRDWGRWGRGALGSDFARGSWVLGSGQRPPEPLPTLKGPWS